MTAGTVATGGNWWAEFFMVPRRFSFYQNIFPFKSLDVSSVFKGEMLGLQNDMTQYK